MKLPSLRLPANKKLQEIYDFMALYCIGLTTVFIIIVTVSIVKLIIAKPVSNKWIYNICSPNTSTFSTLVV